MNRVDSSPFNSFLYGNLDKKNYRSFAALVEKTLYSPSHAEQLFSRNRIRAEIFNFLASKSVKSNEVAKKVFEACVYTAPVALTIMAPELAYKHLENHIVDLSLTYSFESQKVIKYSYKNFTPVRTNILEDPSSPLQVGLSALEADLKLPLKEGEGRLFLCCLYGHRHVFLIEKRQENKYFIFQSYLDHYNFLESLQKSSAHHREWSLDELIESLKMVSTPASKAEWNLRGSSIYEELFHCQRIPPLSLPEGDVGIIPFVFVSTSSYLLDWRAKEVESLFKADSANSYTLRDRVSILADRNIPLAGSSFAEAIHQMVFGSISSWLHEYPKIEAKELYLLYQTHAVASKNSNQSKEFKIFAKKLFQNYLNLPCCVNGLSQLAHSEARELLSLVPLSSMPFLLFEPLDYVDLLWEAISQKAEEGELSSYPTNTNKVVVQAEFITNTYLIGEFIKKSSPELIEAIVPSLIKKYYEGYNVLKEIECHLNQSSHPRKEEQLKAFYRAIGKA